MGTLPGEAGRAGKACKAEAARERFRQERRPGHSHAAGSARSPRGCEPDTQPAAGWSRGPQALDTEAGTTLESPERRLRAGTSPYQGAQWGTVFGQKGETENVFLSPFRFFTNSSPRKPPSALTLESHPGLKNVWSRSQREQVGGLQP